MEITWTTQSNYIMGKTSNVNLTNQKIAAFDMDDTLITTKSGKTFAENDDDWKIYDNSIKNKLINLHNNGYKLVIISNQLGVSKGKVDTNILKSKIQKLINFLQLNFTIFCAINDDHYRKPRMGLWNLINGDKTNSFYCGDAGGLDKRTIDSEIIDKDFSDGDLKFALNVKIKFIHRDEFVFDVKYDSIKVKYPIDFKTINNKSNYIFKPNSQEIILNVGLPASSKSYFSLNNIVPNNYEYINQDTLKTPKKCIMEAEKALKLSKSVVIDNTNLTIDTRKVFIELANKYGIKCRCLIFNTPLEICIHNSYFRNYTTDGKNKIIPKMVYNMMKKKYVKPLLSEGFYEINEIDFALNLSDDMKELYEKYYS